MALSLSGCLGDSGPDLSDDEYPSGTSTDGIDDAQALIETTATALGQQGYEVAFTGPQPTESEYRSSLSTNQQLRTTAHPDQTITIYVADGTSYARVGGTGDPVYGRETLSKSFERVHASNSNIGMEFDGGNLVSANAVSKLSGSNSLRGILEFGSFQPTEVTERHGHSELDFELEGVAASDFDGSGKEVQGSVSVDFDGVVREAMVKVTEQTDGETRVTRHNGFRFASQGDITITAPEWVEQIFNPG